MGCRPIIEQGVIVGHEFNENLVELSPKVKLRKMSQKMKNKMQDREVVDSKPPP